MLPNLWPKCFGEAFWGALTLGPPHWELRGGQPRRGRWGWGLAPQRVRAPGFPGWRKGEAERVPAGDAVGESVLEDENLDHFLDLTCLFLFLPQMNWVSITGQVGGEAEESRGSQRGVLAFLVGEEPSQLDFGTVGGF